MDKQTSADAWISSKRRYYGALTSCLIESLEDLKKSDKDVTYKRLMKTLLHKVQSVGYSQIPQISSGHFLDLTSSINF
jgi:hypothetical protein